MHLRQWTIGLVLIFLSVPPAIGQDAAGVDVQAVLARLGARYANLGAWHFEHQIVIEQTASGGAPVKIVDLKLISASNPGTAQGPLNETACNDKCFYDGTAGQRRTIIGRNGQSAWFYSSDRQEYVLGPTLFSVSGSVAGPFAMSAHLAPLMALDPQSWISPRHVGSESLQVNGETRACDVFEATLKGRGLPLPTGPGQPPPPRPGPEAMGSTTMLLGALALQGMLPPPPSFYVEPPPGAAPGRVRVWVDKEQGLVLKRTVIETARHLSQTATSPDGMAVELQLTDTFTVARTGNAVSEDLFRFQPPEGSKQRVR